MFPRTLSSRPAGKLSFAWILLFAVLSAMPVIKAGEVQLLEVLQLLRLLTAIGLFAYAGFRIPIRGIWKDYGWAYLLFLGVCVAFAVFSLRYQFFPPPELPLLKQPLILSLARVTELFLGIYFMLVIGDSLRSNSTRLRHTLDVYWMIGAISALLSMASAVLLKVGGVNLYFVYGSDLRVRGFFNEAGPYGIFLVSVILVLLVRAHYFPTGFRLLRKVVLVTVLAALFQSSSKAGFVAAVALCGVVGVLAARNRQRIALVGAGAVACFVMWLMLGPQLLNYLSDYSGFEDALTERGDDPSLIMGRIVGAIIVPRMIAEHPVSGIGIGNYSLMRNDPAYLQGLPPVTEWDLPGLGLIGMTAELGIPLTLFWLLLLLRPLQQGKRLKAPGVLLAIAAFQPIAVLVGVNANFFYPWLMTAFALALLTPIGEEADRTGGSAGGAR